MFVLTGVSATLASCSVADAPPNSPAPVKNVADYYYPLSDVGMQYAYLRTTNIGSDTVRLKMQGNDAMSSAIGNTQCFAADLYKIGAFQSDLFFAVNDSEAYTLGTISCGTLGGYWLDLKTPLTEHLQWTFTTNGSYASITVTATVIHRGLKMKMPSGMTFDDVTEVLYVTNNADTTTKWFARGVGMVYSTSNQSDNYFGSQMKFISEIK
ncbi:MAG TPA: hypothetical protein VEW28_00035 [Candidatus Kapabacteria bacterium]|nr:hypothetical protein [Candidatus Kapabacteria bacterium]